MLKTKVGNIEQFDVQYFEHALDQIATTRSGKRLWVHRGQHLGEQIYNVHFNDPDHVSIWVRSSIHGEISAASGEDSIRCWLVRKDDSPLSTKVSAFVTRRPGWESRLKETFTKLRQMRLQAGNCCGEPRSIFRSRADKLFSKCLKCKKFGDWIR